VKRTVRDKPWALRGAAIEPRCAEYADMGMLKEFKEFAMRGNVVDLAVGVVIGAAFGKIVNSLVADVIMPVVGKLTGGIDFSTYAIPIQDAVLDADGKVVKAAVAINIGLFINSVIQFLIVAFAIFMVVKAMNTARARFEKKQDAPAKAPPEDILLLREIRDALAKR
jgi:large conductance mechanosensitive channel